MKMLCDGRRLSAGLIFVNSADIGDAFPADSRPIAAPMRNPLA
jgi:hypothetical protein